MCLIIKQEIMCVLNENNWNIRMNWTMWCVEANRERGGKQLIAKKATAIYVASVENSINMIRKQ